MIKRAQWHEEAHTAARLLSALEETPLPDADVIARLDEAQRTEAPPEDPWRSD